MFLTAAQVKPVGHFGTFHGDRPTPATAPTPETVGKLWTNMFATLLLQIKAAFEGVGMTVREVGGTEGENANVTRS